MFKELKPLLKGGATLCITAADADDDKLRLTISRTAKAGSAPAEGPLARLYEPIVVTGTPDELDVDLPGYLTQHVGTVVGLRTTFEELGKRLEQERKDAEKRIADEKKRGTPAAAAKPAAEKPIEPALF